MEDKIFLDLTDITKKSEVQNRVQEVFLAALREFLEEKFERVEQTGNSTLSVVVGCANDDDGFSNDVCVEVKGTVKHWYDSYRGNKELPRYDIDEAHDEWIHDPKTIKRLEREAKNKEDNKTA